MPQQQPIVTPGDPTFDVEASPGVQIAHPSSTIPPPRGPLSEWRSAARRTLVCRRTPIEPRRSLMPQGYFPG